MRRARAWGGAVLLLAVTAACSDGTGPAEGASLAFDHPPMAVGSGAGFAPAVTVSLRDASGEPLATWTEEVTITLTGGAGVELQGTVSVLPVGGVAAFHDLRVSGTGTGLRLAAVSGGLDPVESAPFDLPGTFQATAVSAGSRHTCALDAQGRAWCWGRNAEGQLGDGTREARSLPTPVTGALTFTTLSAEGHHTCGLTPGGGVYCWGANGRGAVGDGTQSDRYAPVAVVLPERALQVDAGYDHTCALGAGGTAYCWGENALGMLGTGSSEGVVLTPQAVAGLAFKSVSAGYQHACGLTAEGSAYCWGLNLYGEVGVGSRMDEVPEPQPVVGGHRFAWLRAGGGPCHGETCGITVDGATYCWGKNYQRAQGPVRDGWTTAPTRLAGDPGLVWVTPGPLTVCGSTAQGSLYCWGDPQNGELANGEKAPVEIPVSVLSGARVGSVALGATHACAVEAEGNVLCWGRNGDGQLGNPSNPAGWLLPVPVWQPGA